MANVDHHCDRYNRTLLLTLFGLCFYLPDSGYVFAGVLTSALDQLMSNVRMCHVHDVQHVSPVCMCNTQKIHAVKASEVDSGMSLVH